MSSQKQRTLVLITGFITFYCYCNIPSVGATLLAVNKGWCLTYDQSRPGTLVTFSRCRSSNSRQSSWQLLTGPRSTTFMICVSKRLICLPCENRASVWKQWLILCCGQRFDLLLCFPGFAVSSSSRVSSSSIVSKKDDDSCCFSTRVTYERSESSSTGRL